MDDLADLFSSGELPRPLVTMADFQRVPGVVEVRDCDPAPGHVTLVVTRPGLVAWLDEYQVVLPDLTLHEQPQQAVQ